MLRIVTPPAAEPLSRVDAKAQLGITGTGQDALIDAMISAATLDAQARTQRLFVTQTAEWVLAGWPCNFRLPVAPVAASNGITFIKYYDTADVQQTLSASAYVVQQDGPSARVVLKSSQTWPLLSLTPAPEPVVVRFNAGQAAGDVGANVKAAILFTVRHLISLGEQSIFLQDVAIEGVSRRRWVVSADAIAMIESVINRLLMPEQWN